MSKESEALWYGWLATEDGSSFQAACNDFRTQLQAGRGRLWVAEKMIERRDAENTRLKAEVEKYKWMNDDGPFEAMVEHIRKEASETLAALGVDPGAGNSFSDGPSIVNAEAKRLKAEVERLASPQVREIDGGVIEELLAERDKARADLVEVFSVMAKFIPGHACTYDPSNPCEACAEFFAFVRKHSEATP